MLSKTYKVGDFYKDEEDDDDGWKVQNVSGEFIYNEYGICLNPNVIKGSIKGVGVFEIKTAEYNGKWCEGGRSGLKFGTYSGFSYGTSLKQAEYDTELDAQRASIDRAINHFEGCKRNNDPDKVQKIIDVLVCFKTPQLKLF